MLQVPGRYFAPPQGRIAAQAGVRRLVLTHVGDGGSAQRGRLLSAARRYFSGSVEVASDLGVLVLSRHRRGAAPAGAAGHRGRGSGAAPAAQSGTSSQPRPPRMASTASSKRQPSRKVR